MRVFVAIVPPPEVALHLEDFLEPRRDVEGPRWSSPEQWHLTLAFMGAAPERCLEDLLDAVADAVRGRPAVRLAVSGGGCFPDVTRARVLWAGVEGGEGLSPLAAAVRTAAGVAGAGPEGGDFVPHVTLGRFPRPVDATRWLRVLDTYRSPEWTARDVVVVRSHLPRERGHRPRHEVLATTPLAAEGSS